MFLWWVYLDTVEWGAFVIAPSRGKAKYIFYRCSPDYCEFTDIKIRKVKPADGHEARYLDMDCPELESLGVRYMTEEEYNAYLEEMERW